MFKFLAVSLILGASAALTSCGGMTTLPPPPPCQENCRTHTEGYEWAQRANLRDDSYCANYSEAFMAGCRDGVEDLLQFWRTSREL